MINKRGDGETYLDMSQSVELEQAVKIKMGGGDRKSRMDRSRGGEGEVAQRVKERARDIDIYAFI